MGIDRGDGEVLPNDTGTRPMGWRCLFTPPKTYRELCFHTLPVGVLNEIGRHF